MIVVIDWHDVCTSQYYNPYKPGSMYNIYLCVTYIMVYITQVD